MDRKTATVVEYQDRREKEVALVEPDAMRALLHALDDLNAGRLAAGLAGLAAAESLLSDTAAVVFRGSVLGKRAYALIELGRVAEAEAIARRAVELYPAEEEGHFSLARVHLDNGRLIEARAELLILLSYDAKDVPGLRLLAHVDSLIAGGSR
jgi:tetratricopeptide (TPR) repeat protein